MSTSEERTDFGTDSGAAIDWDLITPGDFRAALEIVNAALALRKATLDKDGDGNVCVVAAPE